MNTRKIILSVCIVIFSVFSNTNPVSKGSDVLVSIEPYYEFPSGDPSNWMLTFGYFKSGFGLEDTKTSCTFKSIYPVTGPVNLNGGSLYLNNDLILKNMASIGSTGNIFGNGHVFDFATNITSWSAVQPTVFNNTQLFLNSDLTLSGTVTFQGNCLLDGRDNYCVLDDGAQILIDSGATLHLRNMELDGIAAGKIICLDDSGQLILDNVRWVQEADYSFTQGSILFFNQVNFVGPYSFYYESDLTSTIDYDSCLYLSDIVKLVIGRKKGVYSREPFYFSDVTSVMHLENCSVDVTSSGMRIINGTLSIDGEVIFDVGSSSTTRGLIFGNGNSEHDIYLRLSPGSVLDLSSGCLVDDVVNSGALLAGHTDKKFVRQAPYSVFFANQDLTFSNIELVTAFPTMTAVAPGKHIQFNNSIFSTDDTQFCITGLFLQAGVEALVGNCEINLTKGDLPVWLVVSNTNNVLRGTGDAIGTIILQDCNAELSIGLNGVIRSNIVMNGGSVVLDYDLVLGRNAIFAGVGTVNLSSNKLTLNLADLPWTSDIKFIGSEASLVLNENLTLASEMKFAGNCQLDGNFNTLDLSSTGTITIEPNSCLTIKDVTITGLKDFKIRCLDNSGSILLSNVVCVLDGNYSMTVGSFLVKGEVDFKGTSSFMYESNLTSTIAANSKLAFTDQTGLVIGRSSATTLRQPLFFENNTASLSFQRSSLFVTQYGMAITRGIFAVDGGLTLDIASSDPDYGFSLGDGVLADDPVCYWTVGSIILARTGSLNFNVVDMTKSIVSGSQITCYPNFDLWFNQDIHINGLSIKFDQVWAYYHYHVAPGKTLYYDNMTYLQPGVNFSITGSRFPDGSMYLSGAGCSLVATVGNAPYWIVVSGVGSNIYGAGGIGAPIVLWDSNTVLDIGIAGQMYDNIYMFGGTLNLDTSLYFNIDQTGPQGYGTINIGSQYVYLQSGDFNATSTLYWDGQPGGCIIPDTDMSLSSVWTVSGNVTFWGQGQKTLKFKPTGKIIVERGSTLTFENIDVKGVSEGQIYCKDNAGTVVFDRVGWVQDESFTFSIGSFIVNNALEMSGDGCSFHYQTPVASVINSQSTLTLDEGFIFSYQPSSASRNLLSFADNTAAIVLNNASLASTVTGLQLTGGRLQVEGACSVKSAATRKAEGVVFGDGVNSANNLYIDILPESTLDIASGCLIYNNVN